MRGGDPAAALREQLRAASEILRKIRHRLRGAPIKGASQVSGCGGNMNITGETAGEDRTKTEREGGKMKFDGTRLQERITAECGSMAAFASAMGTSAKRAESLAAMRTVWRQADIVKAAEVLHIAPAEIDGYFFTVSA